MRKTVLLRHETPDGRHHFDWLLAREGDETGYKAESCLTFRISGRIDTSPMASILEAEKTPDHRPDYLDFEGEVSGGRGTVKRVAQGTCLIARETDNEVSIAVDWGAGRHFWFARKQANGRWRLFFGAADAAAADAASTGAKAAG